MTEVISEVLPTSRPPTWVLTRTEPRPEVAEGQPAAAVVAMQEQETAMQLQRLLMGPTSRVYTNPDVPGCESAGALKNVMAIAARSAHGPVTATTRWRLETRALAELTSARYRIGGATPGLLRAWRAWETSWPRASANKAATVGLESNSVRTPTCRDRRRDEHGGRRSRPRRQSSPRHSATNSTCRLPGCGSCPRRRTGPCRVRSTDDPRGQGGVARDRLASHQLQSSVFSKSESRLSNRPAAQRSGV